MKFENYKCFFVGFAKSLIKFLLSIFDLNQAVIIQNSDDSLVIGQKFL